MNKEAARTPGQWISYLKSKGAPKKLINQIKGIEQSGKDYDKSKEYIMRTIVDKIPARYLDKPSKVHGPGKSGPLAEKRKKSSFSFDKSSQEYISLESLIKKIAEVSHIDQVEEIHVSLTKGEGMMKFKIAGEVYPADHIIHKFRDPESPVWNKIYLKKDKGEDVEEDIEEVSKETMIPSYKIKEFLEESRKQDI